MPLRMQDNFASQAQGTVVSLRLLFLWGCYECDRIIFSFVVGFAYLYGKAVVYK